MSLEFHGSKDHTLGVEVELQIVDRESRELVSLSPRILESFPECPWVKHELLQSTIEINTRICRDVQEVEDDLREKLSRVRQVAGELGADLIGAGTHPFSRWTDQKITEDSRYHRLVERVQWPARRLLIFGLHVHVGLPDGESAIRVINGLEPWLPHLLALTASSPFWEGEDTGLASCRTKIFESLPTAGLPYRHESWEDFERLLEALVRCQAVESLREIWWDVRPHARFGTVEVRICDTPPTLRETVAVAALIQALVAYLHREGESAGLSHVHNRIIRENKWRATRWSTFGSTIVDEEGRLEPIAESLEKLLERLEPTFRECGSAHELTRIRQMIIEGPSYARQRTVYRETGDLRAVVEWLVREAEEDRPCIP